MSPHIRSRLVARVPSESHDNLSNGPNGIEGTIDIVN